MKLEFSRDDHYFDRGITSIKNKYLIILLLASGIALLTIAVFLSDGVAGMTPLQIVTLIAVGLIILSMVISFRHRLYISMITFGILLAIYFFEGVTLAYFGAVPEAFSIGDVSIIFIWAFTHWISYEGLKWNDTIKFTVFIILGYVFNVTGWLPQMDSLVAGFLSIVFSGGLSV